MRTRNLKDVDELVELQDRAIQALQQATLALQVALLALQRSVAEKGEQPQLSVAEKGEQPQLSVAEKGEQPQLYSQPYSPYGSGITSSDTTFYYWGKGKGADYGPLDGPAFASRGPLDGAGEPQ